MKKNIAYLLVFICIFCAAGSINAKEVKYSDNVNKIISLAKAKDPYDESGYEIAEIYIKKLSQKEQEQIDDLLYQNKLVVPPYVYVTIADDIVKRDKQKALVFYCIGRLRTTEDGMMCKDGRVLSELIRAYPSLASQTMEYALDCIGKGNTEAYKSAIEEAIKWDNEHTERISPEWICKESESCLFDDGPVKIRSYRNFPGIIRKAQNDAMKSIGKLKRIAKNLNRAD